MFDMSHRKDALNRLMALKYVFDPAQPVPLGMHIYGDCAILHIMQDDNMEDSLRMLKYSADWFEHPHPYDRDIRGEADFAAIRLVCALYEPACYDKLTDDIKDSLKKFFTKYDYSSIYGSENHSLMYVSARLLAAQFYKGEYFENFDISAEDCYDKDLKYLHEFLNFRAGRGWGEFDSLGYSAEIILILSTLHKYAKDDELRNKCHMAMDVILLDMMADSIEGIYGGAHGRSYPNSILNRIDSGMAELYYYYFGGKFYNGTQIHSVNVYLSDYIPSQIVYDVAYGRKMPFENRERKHLHCCSAWMFDILYDVLDKTTGSINKYTYVCDDYILGSVNRQDPYPEGLEDGWYARHQQHEWELTLPGGGEHKIFSHHSAVADYHKINNRWTGDNRCLCGSFYTNKNTAIAMYNIDNKETLPLINAFVPLEIFSEKIIEDKYLFLEYGKLYISLYFDNGYRVNHEDEFENKELLSDGWQNAVVCRVEYKEGFASLAKFAEHIKSMPVVYDRIAKTVAFDNIILREDGNSEDGKENVYPYPKTYDCPFMQSDWDSKVITVTCGDKKVVYDFVNNVMRNDV